MPEYEYGIRHRRDREMHRTRMTEDEAWVFMTEDWGDANPWNIFEIVRRPIGPWLLVANNEKGRPERRPPTVDS